LEDGRLGPTRSLQVRRATLQAPSGRALSSLEPGLGYAYYERSVRRAAALAEGAPTARDTVGAVALKGVERPEHFGVRLSGFLRVPADDVYAFELVCDDGAVLRVAGQTVVEHDGSHSANGRTGAIALAAGLHALELLYFQGEGDRTLELRMRRGESDWQDVPRDWLFRQP
jgi:hexosaminidase